MNILLHQNDINLCGKKLVYLNYIPHTKYMLDSNNPVHPQCEIIDLVKKVFPVPRSPSR